MPTRAKQFRCSPPPRPDSRPNAHDRGYTSRWSRFAKLYLAQHPLCAPCQEAGRVVAASEVHHRDEAGPLGPRGYDETNLLPVCRLHHRRLTPRRNEGQHRDG
jgi:5-methylcytosine-specific restriction enzyme A